MGTEAPFDKVFAMKNAVKTIGCDLDHTAQRDLDHNFGSAPESGPILRSMRDSAPTLEELSGAVNEVVSVCGCLHLRKAARSVTRHFDRALKPARISSNQLVLLVVIAEQGESTQASLARTLSTDQTTLSRNLRALESKGWIRTKKPKQLQAAHPVQLTAKGRGKLAEAYPIWRCAQDEIVEQFGEGQWTKLIDLASQVG